ncbi:MAG: hypothetical protein ACXWCC_13560, partial [Caldimonas sp.]
MLPVVITSSTTAIVRALTSPSRRGSTANAPRVAGALGGRQVELMRRVADAHEQARVGGAAEPPRGAARELPRLAAAALAQARFAQGHGNDERRRRAAVAPGASLDYRFGEHRREVEGGVELERWDQPVPGERVVDAGEGGIEGRRRGEAGAADRDAARHRQGTATAARHERRESRQALGADAARAPATADRAQAGPAPRRSGAHSAGREHRLNILPGLNEPEPAGAGRRLDAV